VIPYGKVNAVRRVHYQHKRKQRRVEVVRRLLKWGASEHIRFQKYVFPRIVIFLCFLLRVSLGKRTHVYDVSNGMWGETDDT